MITDRSFLVMWGLTVVLLALLIFVIFYDFRVTVENNALLKAIMQYHHINPEMPQGR